MYVLAPSDYERTVIQLTFSPTVDVNPVSVNIVNDDIHEDSETFFGNLAVDADQPVDLDPANGIMIISDEDSESLMVVVNYSLCVHKLQACI